MKGEHECRGVQQRVVYDSHDRYQNVLGRSIVLALQAVGFDDAEKVALHSFQGLVEECMYRRGIISDPIPHNMMRHCLSKSTI